MWAVPSNVEGKLMLLCFMRVRVVQPVGTLNIFKASQIIRAVALRVCRRVKVEPRKIKVKRKGIVR